MRYSLPVLFIFMLSLILSNTSYAFTPAPSSDPTLPQISLQLVVRNSQGQLVSYFEPSVVYIRNVSGVHDYLNLLGNKTTIIKNNQTLYEYKFDRTNGFDHFGQYTQYGIWYNNDSVLMFSNNGYLAGPGDTLDVHWKIISTR